MLPTEHTITCHYEDATGEHEIAVTLYREFHGTARDWRITTDLSDVPAGERESVEQQAIDGAEAAPVRKPRRKGDRSGEHTSTRVYLRADEDAIERWDAAATRMRVDRTSFLRAAAGQLADQILGPEK